MSIQSILDSAIDNAPKNTGIAATYTSAPGSSTLDFGCSGNIINDKTSEPMTLDADTAFEMGSISKTFTTLLCFAIDQAQGGTQLDAPLSDFIEGLPSNIAPLTIGSLLSYVSGLPQDDPPDPNDPDHPKGVEYPYDVCAMVDFLTSPGITVDSPGSFAYSNLGFSLAGIATPGMNAGMRQPGNDDLTTGFASLLSSTVLQASSIDMPATHFYSPADDASLPKGPNGPTNPTWPAQDGGGGLVTTLTDMGNWLRFNMGLATNATLSPLLTKIFAPQSTTPKGVTTDYAWFESSVGSLDITWKAGGEPSFSSWIGFTSTAPQLGVVVWTNMVKGPAQSTGARILQWLAANG
ncbi:MAG: serine hydrolase domain-containing protein [Nannocystaceae bacterium]